MVHKTLQISFHGRIIDHLGLQMYQKPVSALAEMVSNSWDADSEKVWIILPDKLNNSAEIVIKDDGEGMTFEECESLYLNIGRDRRITGSEDHTSKKRRLVLGRKGIGKFAGFGIAETIRVDTISGTTGERTVFDLHIKELRTENYVQEGGKVKVVQYEPPNAKRKKDKGTTITLKNLILGKAPPAAVYARSMARRFLLRQWTSDFEIYVNGSAIPESAELERAEFMFPRDYTGQEKPEGLSTVDSVTGWGTEEIESGVEIKWRILFYEEPIGEEEITGIAVFCRGKMAQEPFFFNLAGGLGGQHGQSYMTGQVIADHLDEQPRDTIATDRQGITWENPEAYKLEKWGQQRLKKLLRIWKDRRGQKRRETLEKKVEGFSSRLKKLGPVEEKTVKKALLKIGGIVQISDLQFEEIGDAILTAWEHGRLRDLIDEISRQEELEYEDFLSLMNEAQVLAALSIAEAIETKIYAIGGLKDRIKKKELENAVRDFLATNPWIINPKWEFYKKEISTKNLLEDAARASKLYEGGGIERIDLALFSGKHLIILEFMRPGRTLDRDHINRFEWYFDTVETKLKANTAGEFDRLSGYIVADKLDKDPVVLSRILEIQKRDMFAMDWNTLLSNAINQWKEFLTTVISRAPDDERLKSLTDFR